MLKNGKLFGKINVIDFLAILAVVVVIAAAAVFVLRPKDDTLIIKFRIEEVDGFVAKKVHIGDEMYDDTNLQDIGVVTDVELSDSISYGQVNDSVYTLTSKEGYYSMIITGEVKTQDQARRGDRRQEIRRRPLDGASCRRCKNVSACVRYCA